MVASYHGRRVPVWCLKSTHNDWIDVGQTNYPQYIDFCYDPLPIGAVQGHQPRRWWLLTMATGAQCGVWNGPPMLELTSDKENYPQYMDFCHNPLTIGTVQGPKPRRWWLLTMDTGAQCGVWNQPTTLELTLYKQNQAQYMDFCHKPLPIGAVQGPSIDDGGFLPWPLGPNVVFEIDPYA